MLWDFFFFLKERMGTFCVHKRLNENWLMLIKLNSSTSFSVLFRKPLSFLKTKLLADYHHNLQVALETIYIITVSSIISRRPSSSTHNLLFCVKHT